MIIDGLGGGLGSQITEKLNANKRSSDIEIIALGTNAQATSRMINAGADNGATGENSFKVLCARADIILGPLGIIMPHAMKGEITPAMAEAVGISKAKKFLLGIKQPHLKLIGVKDISLNKMIEEMVEKVIKIVND
ncbi:MAG: DUF3842 family protein [Halanaerobiales bacterium]